MNNFTTNIYEMKREILNFSKKVSDVINKSTSKSLKNKAIVWLSQIFRGIKEILKYVHNRIKEWIDI